MFRSHLAPASICLILIGNAFSMSPLPSHYAGILPSVLVEPYDKVDAVEVNIFPLAYEYRGMGAWTFQARPMVNYRFLEGGDGISHLGGTVMTNRYLPDLFDLDWLIPVAGPYFSYTYNRLDDVHVLIGGLEAGAAFRLSGNWTLSAALQPGMDYFPDRRSRDIAGTESGWLPHYGVMIHFGVNWE